jgi:hypothetical protein
LKNVGRLKKKFKLSSILKKIEVVFHFEKIEVVFYLRKIEVVFHFEQIEVVFNISSSWVKVRLHIENQTPLLPRTALIVMGPGVVVVVWWCGFFYR